jgi:hypothetical protein
VSEGATPPKGDHADAASGALGFLAPSDRPQSLGRLGLYEVLGWIGQPDTLDCSPGVSEGATAPEGDHADAASGALGFLAPSDRPQSLGHLGLYEVLGWIGQGGMGIVLKAHDERLNRIVALKVLMPSLAANALARRRFLREAQAAAAVCHEHVVTIHAVAEAEGLTYLVMQLVDGISLQQKLNRDGPLSLKEILRIGMQTASGLTAAHAQGLVHRDIKPANILLEDGIARVKITDFGLARAVDDASVSASGTIERTSARRSGFRPIRYSNFRSPIPPARKTLTDAQKRSRGRDLGREAWCAHVNPAS